MQEQCKENLKNGEKTPKQDDSNPTIPAQDTSDINDTEDDEHDKAISDLNDAIDILLDYDLNHKPYDSVSTQAQKDAIALAMKAWGCDYDYAKTFINAYRKKQVRLAEETRTEAEVAKAAAILNDDPKPKLDYGEYSKMFVDVDALEDDDFDHAW